MGEDRSDSAGAASLVRELGERIRDGAAPAEIIQRLEAAPESAREEPLYWYHLGYARLQSGDSLAGAEALERSLALHEHANTWHYLGYARIDLGEFEAAREALSHCLDLGGSPQARYELAYAYLREGQPEEAAKAVRAYLLKNGDDFDAWELYEAACRQLGRRRTYRRFLNRRADPPLMDLLKGRDRFSMGDRPFPVPFEGRAESNDDVKLEFLTHLGGAYLGTADDDGLSCPSFRDRELSPADIAVMLVRLSGVLATVRVRISAVIAVDDESMPAAEAAAELLKTSAAPPGTGESAVRGEGGTALLLQLVGHDWMPFQRAALAFGEPVLTAVLAFDWFQDGLPFEPRFAPDITGCIALRASVAVPPATRSARQNKKLSDRVRQVRATEAETQRQYYRMQPGLRFRG